MTTDFNLRVYLPNKGNDPKILTQEQFSSLSEKSTKINTLELRPYSLYLRENQEEPFGKAVRYKQVRTPNFGQDNISHTIGFMSDDKFERGTARKVIYRKQPNTNNITEIAIDYLSDETAKGKSAYRMNSTYGQKVVELSRDLNDGDVLELVARQDKQGKVTTDKLALKSGKVIENIPEFFQKLAKELDPLAKNWIRKVLKSLI